MTVAEQIDKAFAESDEETLLKLLADKERAKTYVAMLELKVRFVKQLIDDRK